MTIPFPATYSLLDPDALLAEILNAHYGLTASKCELHSRGMNDVYRVSARPESSHEERTYFLRVSRAHWKTEDQIRFEMRVLKHLADGGAPVAEPISRSLDRSGGSLDDLYTTISAFEGKRQAALFSPAVGDIISWDQPERFRHYGRALAKIHKASNTLPNSEETETSLAPNVVLAKALAALEPLLASSRPGDWAYLCDLADRIQKSSLWLDRNEMDWGVCHGDSMGQNAHITDSDAVTFFDFDCCGYGPRAYDLATVRWANWSAGIAESPVWPHVLQGYEEVRVLSQADRDAIPLCVALRGIWIMWYHAANASIFGCAETDDAYFDKRFQFLRAWDTTWLSQAAID
ncbi:MAG: hypothetical protein JWQ02_1667 [Capsulimonas sp.]|nr:hypothetical protein [Capsulimonas sp.]